MIKFERCLPDSPCNYIKYIADQYLPPTWSAALAITTSWGFISVSCSKKKADYTCNHRWVKPWEIDKSIASQKEKYQGNSNMYSWRCKYHQLSWHVVPGPVAICNLPSKLYTNNLKLRRIHLVGKFHIGSMVDQFSDNPHISLLGCHHQSCLLRDLEWSTQYAVDNVILMLCTAWSGPGDPHMPSQTQG